MMILLRKNDDRLTPNDDFSYAENKGKFPPFGAEIFQPTDKGFRTKVLSPLSYFTEKQKYGII